jgi:hypothetical protein
MVWSLPTVLIALLLLVVGAKFGSKEGEVDQLTNPRNSESDASASNHPLLFPEHGWKYDLRYTRFRSLPAKESLQNREWQHDLKRFQAEISRKQSQCSRNAGCYTQGRSGSFALTHFYTRDGSHPLRSADIDMDGIGSSFMRTFLGYVASFTAIGLDLQCSLLLAPILKAPGFIDTPTDSFPGRNAAQRGCVLGLGKSGCIASMLYSSTSSAMYHAYIRLLSYRSHALLWYVLCNVPPYIRLLSSRIICCACP